MVTNLQINQPISLFVTHVGYHSNLQLQCDTPGYQALHLTQQGFRLHAGSFYLGLQVCGNICRKLR